MDKNGWISVDERLPEGNCLVYLEEETLGSRVHSASYDSNVEIIGGYFHFDMPKVTHWQPLLAPPEAT